jgi:hypothetical protein
VTPFCLAIFLDLTSNSFIFTITLVPVIPWLLCVEMRSTLQLRVEDSSSRAQWNPRRGIHAGLARSGADFHATRGSGLALLEEHLRNHVDWYNTHETPFISTYNSYRAAYAEAFRRIRCGKKDVIIIWIDVTRAHKKVQYRNMRTLARKLGITIPPRAWHNSEFEFVFLHHIPDSAITEITEL